MKKQVVIRIQGLADGSASAFDGQYLVEYDPERDGLVNGHRTDAHLVTTPDIGEAKVLDLKDALETWKRIPERRPTRADGKPNRPLTAFTCSFVSAP